MIKLFTSFLALMLISSLWVNAQVSPFEQGYLIQGNDTIQGYIKSATDLDLSRAIQFKTDLNSERVTEYYPGDITAFYFENSKFYYATVNAEIIKGSSYQEAKRFAKLLLSGYTNLYKLQVPEEEQSIVLLKNNTFLYILQKDTTFYTLGLYETMQGNYPSQNKRYVGTLTAAFYDCDNHGIKLERLNFDEKSIITAVTKYNTCKSPAVESTLHEYKAKAIIKHGAEVSLAKMYIPKNPSDLSGNGYSVAYFWDIVQPDASRKLSTKLGVSYTFFDISYTYFKEGFEGHNQENLNKVSHFIRFPFSVQYNLKDPLTSESIPFINAGLTPQFSSEFNRSELIPLPSVGFGMYRKRFRYSVLLENEGFAISSPKIMSFSIGMRLD